MVMFNIELESNNEEFKKWNRKLFVLGRAEKLLINLQSAQSFIGENRFSEAIQTANEIWQKIKENGLEDEPKKNCRNILTEGYQGEDNWEDAAIFNQENLKAHANDMKTLILALRDAIHGRRFEEIRDKVTTAEQVLNNIVLKEEGNEVYLHYRKELLEMIYLTNHMKGCPKQIDEDTADKWFSPYLLPPRPDQSVQPDFSVKPSEDVEMELQKSIDAGRSFQGPSL
jgi:isopenicillin N synthase-like dioxygenase